jgi:hypothetical protein
MSMMRPVVGIVMTALIVARVGDQQPPQAAGAEGPASYAPAADLQRYVEMAVGTLDQDLSQEATYNIPRVKRVARTANTLAAVAVVLGHHDGATPLKEPARAIKQASLLLAEHAGEYQPARSALDELKKVIATLPKGPPPAWAATGDIEQLMLQVPVLARELQKSVRGTAFAESRDEAAALSATLAAVARISMLDHTYCANARDQRDWDELCRRMQDAAADSNRAIRAAEREALKHALRQLDHSCDDCHERFRVN